MTTNDDTNRPGNRGGRARRLFARVSLAAAGVLLTASASPAFALKDELQVKLRFIPTEAEEVLEKRGVIPVAGPPFEIQLVSDARPEKGDRIGTNVERGGNRPVLSRTDVAAWVSQVLGSSFREWGTPSTTNADLLIEPELLKLFVVEEHTYKAEVTIKFRLRKRGGPEIWAGVVGGAASRFGRSFKEENYQEVLSDALLSCISKFWADPGFREVWASGKGPGGTGGAATKPAPAETLTPEAAKAKLLELKNEGFDDDMLAYWVRKVAFTRPLTADDLIDWRRAGVPQAAIKATME